MGFLEKVGAGLFGTDTDAKASPRDWPWTLDYPASWLSGAAPVDIDTAVGLPAWYSVIRRIAGTFSLAPLEVYRGPRENRERDTDSWQYRLLHSAPGAPGELTPSRFRLELASSYAADGNAFVLKIKTMRGKVGELVVLDPRLVHVERRAGQIVYLVDEGDTAPRVYTPADVIHAADLSFGGLRGVSPIDSLRVAVTSGLHRQTFESSYYKNDSRPGLALKFPESLTRERAQEALDHWNSTHQGPENAGKASALGGGADLVTVPPVSLVNAQFVETKRLGLQTIAGLYGVPPHMLGDTSLATVPTPEQDLTRMATYVLGPIYVAVQDALNADRDLFPQGVRFAEFNTAGLVRADLATRSGAYREARQGGWMTANEVRELENLPPHPDGDALQITPVGGESNPDTPAEPEGDTDDPGQEADDE